MADERICPYCKGPVRTGTKCPKCACLYHASCENRQPKAGKWQCCSKTSKHTTLDNNRFNGASLTLLSPLDGTSLEPIPSTSTQSGLSDAPNVPASGVADLAAFDDEAMDTLDTLDSGSIPTKSERVSPTPSPNGFVTQHDTPNPISNAITLQQFSSLLSAEFAKNNQGIYSRIDQLASQISVIDNKVKPIAELNQAMSNLDNRVAALENQVPPPQPPNVNIDNLAFEIQDRLARSRNIILYGVNEMQGASQQSDSEQVATILSRVPGLDLSNIVTRRLGKLVAGGKPRPLLVRLISADEVRRILRNRHCLPRGVSASSDKTTSERDYLKALIYEVTRLNESDPTNKKKIKYINGTPTIVDDKPPQRGSKN